MCTCCLLSRCAAAASAPRASAAASAALAASNCRASCAAGWAACCSCSSCGHFWPSKLDQKRGHIKRDSQAVTTAGRTDYMTRRYNSRQAGCTAMWGCACLHIRAGQLSACALAAHPELGLGRCSTRLLPCRLVPRVRHMLPLQPRLPLELQLHMTHTQTFCLTTFPVRTAASRLRPCFGLELTTGSAVQRCNVNNIRLQCVATTSACSSIISALSCLAATLLCSWTTAYS